MNEAPDTSNDMIDGDRSSGGTHAVLRRWRDARGVPGMVRDVVLVGVLVVGWLVFVPYLSALSRDGNDILVPLIGGVFGAGVVTMLVIGSFRSERLRRALLPFEVGAGAAGLIVLDAYRTDGEYALSQSMTAALTAGVLATLFVAFLNPFLEGRSSRTRWLTGALSVIALICVASLFIDGMVYGELADEWTETPPSVRLMSRITPTGDVRLGAPGPGSDGLFMAAAEVGDPAADPMATTLEAALTADAGGRLQLEVLGVRPGASTQVELRRGACSSRTGAGERAIDRWRLSGAASGTGAERLRVTGLQLDDLRLDDQMHSVIGSGAPFAPVLCTDLVYPAGIAVAQAGLARMHAECIKPLAVDAATGLQLTAASFQDAVCSERFRQLVDVLDGVPFADVREADALVVCLARATVWSQRVRVGDGAVVANVGLATEDGGEARAVACFEEVGPTANGVQEGTCTTGPGATCVESVGAPVVPTASASASAAPGLDPPLAG